MYFSVDRIVSGKAALIGEDKKPLEISVKMLPAGTKEGDMLHYDKGAFHLAPGKTIERRERVADVLGQLLNHGEEEK